jgi:PH (Pleckstrin Homology) domain-containing protein
VRTPLRVALIVVGAILFVVGAYQSQGPPRLTVLNTGFSVTHGLRHPAGALMAAVGAILLAKGATRRGPRVFFIALAILSVGVSIHLASYRVDADHAGLASRSLLRWIRIPWSEVAGVDGDAGLVVVTGKNQNKIRVDTTDFRPDQRATLDRTISRRVRESSPAKD